MYIVDLHMRPSPLRHPLAVLRLILKMGQAELAELCGCSTPTIQAVELCKLPLSKGLAVRVAEATGISVEWLLNGDPEAPPKVGRALGTMLLPRSRYTYEVYENHRAVLEVPTWATKGDKKADIPKKLLKECPSLVGAPEVAQEQDAELIMMYLEVLKISRDDLRGMVLRWRLRKFLEELAAEFACNKPWRPEKTSGKPHRSKKPQS
jgi:transcriptional regulator with XRE-family HTH domain